jgi:hypothetical protein
MDKAILFGVFDFVNFHVCKTLLEKGIEVKGIHIGNIDRIDYLDEKRFEVGRNANFYEDPSLVGDDQTDSGSTIIISLYDLYMTFKEEILRDEAVTKPILDFLKMNQEKGILVVFLLPIQLSLMSMDRKAFSTIKSFLQQSMDKLGDTQLIFLPAIYGPWQPKTFLFQQSILTKMNRNMELKEIREGTMDALYVDDAIKAMLEIISSRVPGGYLVESGRKNHWRRCAAYLNMDKNLGETSMCDLSFEGKEIKRVPTTTVSPIADSLEKQIEHMQRLLKHEL